ncbi:integrase_H2C2 domain-containing protein [Trichonephila clavipes]|uniref:Integrase_H2C2 domain-containing protein n=1 Tax=Trichonephila clavipes TaxID=2585209 RepID=A0A8X6SBE6_TRICX|nr:integrase_H2C2 domain-containing protein [Trichonephila clavipes]
MAEAQSFELLKTKRKSLRTAVIKIVNELEAELSSSDLNVDRLCELVEILCIKFEPLTLIDQQMEPLFKPEEFDGEFEIAEKYGEKVLLWQFRAKKKINEFSKPRVTSPSLQTTLSQSQDEHFRNSDNIRIKVPKYHITRFYGDDASKWLTFWNSFETAVHNNESLNKVDKFNYLKAHLGGSALNTVEGFPISAKAYDEAVELLKNRFANPEILIQAHMNKILSLQPLKNSNDLRSFRKFVDNYWEKEGIIEKIAHDEPKNGGKFHYLPHRPVFKENSTTKIRRVFDGSAHHGKSCLLNDCVEKGPNLIVMIRAILNRFRLGKIGVISDIRKAFLQLSLHENDMNFLPFLWWKVVIWRKLLSTGIVEWFLKFLAVPFY